ncbi:ATP-binding protein [Streptomyces sp. p1417]|uniref:ATP-binding protein n=1 Tax=Streptomyces typhae TaxID=2681492 RepID=A0A6L6WT20_9ACTN|nr:ATP-binding protein [Streptomyces typhae]MVO83516.1 ATP-binding protein [Streptomyces typhae]
MTRRARIAVSGDPTAVAFARDRVTNQIQAWGVQLGEEKLNAVELVASELITNAVVHAGGLITIGLYLDEDRLLLVVHDSSPEPPSRQITTENDEGGRGLVLVEFLATRHGWEPTAHGKKVWAEFVVPVSVPAARGGLLHERLRAAAPQTFVHVMPERFALAPGM